MHRERPAPPMGSARRGGDSDGLEHLARVGLIAYGVVHLLVAWLAAAAGLVGRRRRVGRPVRRDVDRRRVAGRQAPAVDHRARADRAGRLAGGRGAALAQRLVGLRQGPHKALQEVRQGAGQGGRSTSRWRCWPSASPPAAASPAPSRSRRPPRASSAGRAGSAGRRRRAGPHRLGRLPRLQGRDEALPQADRHLRRAHRRRSGWSPGSGRSASPARASPWRCVGGLLVYAAVTFDPSKAQGLDGALRTVLELPFGPILLTLVALGIAAFGAFLFVRARYPERT